MGVRLFASTEQPVYRLEPTPEEGEPRGRWSLSLQERTGEVENTTKGVKAPSAKDLRMMSMLQRLYGEGE